MRNLGNAINERSGVLITALVIALIIAVIGWWTTQRDLDSTLENFEEDVAEVEAGLAVCENPRNDEERENCLDQLDEFDELLRDYREQLMELEGQN